jgi:phenylpropionate dioxygenase-like ring-hydroxylating dioxygenase large terminal subunit
MRDELQSRIREELAYEAGRDAPPPGFPALPEIPGGRYTDPDFHALEIEHVFLKSWLPTARLEEFDRPGSYLVWKKMGRPVLLVRGKDDIVRAFYNSCRHRGAALTPAERGHGNLLRCQYHSWSYDLTGRLVAVPDERDFCGLDKSARGLIPIRCETYGGTVFVNFDDDAPPLAEAMAPLLDEWACMEMHTLRVVMRQTTEIACNWKAALDAFQEVYHVNTIHPDTLGTALNSRATALGLFPHGHSRMVSAYHARALATLGLNVEGQPDIPGATALHRQSSTAYLMFPNLISPFRSIFVQQLRFWPRGVGRCELEVVGLGPDWGDGPKPDYWDMAVPAFRKVLDEDMANLGSIQESLESGAFTGMMLNYQERRIYWTHEEIDRRIGAERIPPSLRVRQVLGGYVETMVPEGVE